VATAVAPQWKPIGSIERRILGVLVEKAKTTPDAYPLSLNALTTGCNQKNNRDPQMHVEADDVAEALDGLRGLNAVLEVHGDSRVARYKHRLYEWLGVDKVELAVMAELLLRGAQTVGELRGRAARMEPIVDLAALKPVLESLAAKKLVAYLTPQQRGAVVTHLLYQHEELEKVHRIHGAAADEPPTPVRSASEGADGTRHAAGHRGSPTFVPQTNITVAQQELGTRRAGMESQSPAAPPASEQTALQNKVNNLAAEVAQLRSALDSAVAELRRDVDDMRRQLGIV
jgi:uncharacterized protein YceH (UPF0502 family)